MPKTITLQLDENSYNMLRMAAESERRNISNYIEYAAINFTLNDLFVSDKEMKEIEEIIPGLNESLTDAKELITVKEGLSVELAEGNITEEDYVGALYLLDSVQYEHDKENNDTTLRKAIEKLFDKGLSEEAVIDKVDSKKSFYENLVIQPSKPVQRFSV